MTKVVVGLSGGVDSTVAVILLKNKGYEVIGVTFLFTDEFDPKDAIEVAKKLNIEHHILDYKTIFKEKVINNFINDYNKGLTPNPCVLCNRLIKFNFLYESMLKYNADYFATGHYAKVINGKLYKSSDKNKDQTYFLSNITKEQLNKVLFPLEGIDKEKVRHIASEYGLINATKKDSTDVCFITSNFKDYIKDKIINKKGKVINVLNNEVIGEHDGLNRYTIGQRRGLNMGGTKERMYVVGKDIENNILYIATGDDNEYLITTSCILDNVNLFNEEKIDKCNAKFRYRQDETEVELNWLEDNKVEVIYEQGIKSVTPGQICTFYKDDECLGGGIIKEVRKNNKKLWYL
ncbi:MAG: tRNA 2-thiouridine(34) synthase MnmA [Bacilli bacterium]|nr:tRNA 2-thiouridine(34) synthase MnmA [Bacilli bacterium]